MGLLDGGIEAIFGGVFGALYLDGQIIQSAVDPIYDDEGNIVGHNGGDPVACKVQIDAVTWAMQQSDGYTDGDVRLIVLSAGLSVTLTTDHRIVARGKEWLLATVERDAAYSHYVCRGRAS